MDTTTKTCPSCKIEKPFSEYHKVGVRNNKQRYRIDCKICLNNKNRKTIRYSSEDSSKVCTQCHAVKPLDAFDKQPQGALGHTAKCRKCTNENEYVRLHGHKLTYIQRPLIILSKLCTGCNTEKCIDDFYPDRYKKDGYRRYCKKCDYGQVKKYCQTNNEYVNKRSKMYRPAWYIRNIERERARSKRKYQSNPEMYYARSTRRRARKKAAVTEAIHYSQLLKQYGSMCHICGKHISSKSDLHFDHVIPLARGGSHTEANIKPSHKVCNLRKGDKLMEELSDFRRRGP